MEKDREYYRDILQKLESGEYVSIGGLLPVPKDYASNMLAAQVVYGLITKEEAISNGKLIAQLTKTYIDALKPEIDVQESLIQEIRRELIVCLNQRTDLINEKWEPESSSTPCSWSGQWTLNMKDNETGKEDVILTLT